MTKLEIKGTIISNNQKWIYDLFEMDSTSPKDILLPENNEPLEVVINSEVVTYMQVVRFTQLCALIKVT